MIAMTGSGSAGYFIQDRTIVNMDGLISSYDYFLHLQAGTGADYLAALGVDHVFGNSYIVTDSDPYSAMLAGRLAEQAIFRDGDKVLVLWGFVR